MAGMTIEDFKIEYPDLYGAIYKAGETFGRGSGARMKTEMSNLDKSKPQNGLLPVEERAKIAWDNDSNLRLEFDSDYSSWLAYYKADEAGQVKILGRREGHK